jgi:Fe-S cluster assembly ATP-binding protein
MSTLIIENLHATVAGKDILRGLNLQIESGEVHAVMGPNGAGKSTLSAIVMGKPGYVVTSGSVRLDGVEMLGRPTWERAVAGLHLIMQYPTEVPGVRLRDVLAESLKGRNRSEELANLQSMIHAEASRIGFDEQLLERAVNVDFSGGEKKRNETLQLSILKPKFAILDELDSGLDVDALRDCARRVMDATQQDNLGALVITHYSRLLEDLKPDRVHILVKGRIVESGGPELADVLERDGYAAFAPDEPEADNSVKDSLGLGLFP